MCFDAKTSFITFCLGVCTSLLVMTFALLQNKTSLAILSGGWIWVIFMQWWEYMIWSQWNASTATSMAYMFNIMQVPFLYFLFVLLPSTGITQKAVATGIVFLYTCIMLYPPAPISVERNGHLNYSWWSNKVRVVAYFVGLAAIFSLLVRPFYWSMACLATLFILLALSSLLYNQESTSSLWCYFAVFFPVIALIYSFLI